jgi:hypothetical protein
MNKELEIRLEEINEQISNLHMLGGCRDCIRILVEEKEWLESMIANWD